jgi:hypothetical protein
MFSTVSYQASKEFDPLKELVSSAKKILKESMQLVRYPDEITVDNWKSLYKEIDKSNCELLDSVNKKSGVYAILALNHKKRITLKYIGQTASEYSKQRIRAHLVWRNKITRTGKFTGSKFDEVQAAVVNRSKVYISFVEINPDTLRHYVEESLLKYFSPEWNIQQVPEMNGLHRSLCDWDDYLIEDAPESAA